MTGLSTDTAPGALFQVQTHGLIQGALKELQQIITCLFIHGYPRRSLFIGKDSTECMK
jgi:hypothetical protein